MGQISEAAAACRLPRMGCTKGNQWCTGRCKQGRCATCANGATLLLTPDRPCWLAWGSFGSGDGKFNTPAGVAAGGSGQTYVADFSNQRIQEFDATGRFVRQWGRLGSGDG